MYLTAGSTEYVVQNILTSCTLNSGIGPQLDVIIGAGGGGEYTHICSVRRNSFVGDCTYKRNPSGRTEYMSFGPARELSKSLQK